MKEPRLARGARERKGQLGPDAEKLVSGALGLANSGSRAEDQFWERALAVRLERLLDGGHNQTVMDAVERLQQTDLEAYGALVEAIENAAESVQLPAIGDDQVGHEVLLLSVPLVAWTRFRIGYGAIAPALATQFATFLLQEILAKGVQVAIAPYFYSVDQLPKEFSQIRRLTKKLGQAALDAIPFKFDIKDLPETADMLADSRYLVAAVAAPTGHALFRWQELDTPAHVSRVAALERWITCARPSFEALLPGCGFECLLPDAYHINLRESDRRVRPHALRAAVNFLCHTMNIDAKRIRASIAGFGAHEVDEYRIGLSIDDSDDVAQGVVWPVFGPEGSENMAADQGQSDEPGTVEVIKAILFELNINEVRFWPNIIEPEYCEDCGAPMFPNPKGDTVHIEMPEDAEPAVTQFH
jgi:hypothetical protein